MPRSEFVNALASLEDMLGEVDDSLKALVDAMDSAGGFGGGGGGKGAGFVGGKGAAKGVVDSPAGGGGVASLIPAGLRPSPQMLLAAAAGTAANVLGAGAISASRGGDFETGALGAVNRLASKVPIIGEISGLAREERAVRGVEKTAEQIAEVEARGGRVTPEFRTFLLEESKEIEDRRQKSLDTSKVEIERIRREGKGPFIETVDLIRAAVMGPGAAYIAAGQELFR